MPEPKITLDSLLSARLAAIIEETGAADALPPLELAARQADAALEGGKERAVTAAAGHVAADRAIHDLLVERGMHSLVDAKTGTVIIYAPTDQPPGWFMTHPIPGKAS